MDRDCLNELGKYIIYGEQEPHSTVLPVNTLHIGQGCMPLGIDARHITVVHGKPTARRLLQRISLLAPQVFLDLCSRRALGMELPGAPQKPLNST